jgi:hypothetical protein
VSASIPSNELGADKRRSTRVVLAVPIIVRGMDALGQAFKEATTTTVVNCGGCRYRSRHYVPKDSRVTVEIPAPVLGAPPRIVPASVVWVQRPRTFREMFYVALAFEIPGNVWGIDAPPADWFPHPDDENLEVPVSGEAVELERPMESVYIPPAVNLAAAVAAQAPVPVTDSRAAVVVGAGEAKAALDRVVTLVIPAPSKVSELEFAAAREMVKSAVESAMADEMAKMRGRLELRLEESVQETMKHLAGSIADTVMKDLVERATERTAAIIVEARHACAGNAEQLDGKIRGVLKGVLSAKGKPRKPSAVKPTRKLRKGKRETAAAR